MANGLRLLPQVAPGWNLAAHSRHAQARGSPASRSRGRAQCGDLGQSVGQDDGKRGPRGYDAGKKINGRKRHILVDTLGLLLGVAVHAANIQDRDGAKQVLNKVKGRLPRLLLIWADGGYAGQLVGWVEENFGWVLEIVKRDPDAKGFKLLPRRWVVERTFGWLGRHRRLSKDYESLPETSEALIHLAMIRLMLRRLERANQSSGP